MIQIFNSRFSVVGGLVGNSCAGSLDVLDLSVVRGQ